MAITKEFMEVVQSGKIRRVRIMLEDSLLLDPTAERFNEMECYASKKMGNIYAEHDGENLNFDKSAWNKDYLNQQMAVVIDNFSKERINLLKKMVLYLYKDKADKIRNNKENTHTSQEFTRKQVGTGAVAAGAVLAVAGICTSQTVLAVGGVVVAAAGVVLVVSDKGNN